MRSEQLVNSVVNIGSDVEVPILDLANIVIRETEFRSSVEFLPPLPEGDMTRRQPDISLMRSVLNWPLTPLIDGLRRSIAAIRQGFERETGA